jgi:hypothetical protein
MFKDSKVSPGGRWIITVIFVLAIFGPEIFMMIKLAQLGAGIGMSLIRIALAFVLYYFAMLGHGWARWITAFILIMATAIIIGAAGREVPFVALGAAVIFIPSIAILLGLKSVQAKDRMRLRRRRTHS